MELKESGKFLLGLLGDNIAVLGLHDDSLEYGLERLHIWVLSSHEGNWTSEFLVYLSLWLAELLSEFLLDDLGYVSAVVFHEEISIPVSSEVVLDLGFLKSEAVGEELINDLLLGGELVEDKMSVTLSDSHEWNLDHVFFSEGLFDALSISWDTFCLPYKENNWGEDTWVLDLWLLLYLVGGYAGLLVVDGDSSWSFADFELFLCSELWKSLVILSSNHLLVFAEIKLLGGLDSLLDLLWGGLEDFYLVAVLEELNWDVSVGRLVDLLVEESVSGEISIREIVLELYEELV